MRRYVLIALTAVGMLLSAARPADAQWFFLKWLEELSPPGDFGNVGIHLTMLCVPDSSDKTRSDQDFKTAWDTRRTDYKFLFCDRDPLTWKRIKRFYGMDLSTGWGPNKLTYPAGAEPLPHITVQTVSATGGARLNSLFDAGGSVGFARFSGQTGTAFNKTMFNFYIAYRPFATNKPPPPALTAEQLNLMGFKQRSVEIRFGMYFFPQGLTLANFGATGATVPLGPDEMKGHPAKSFLVEFSFPLIR
jgi:hypothetical protein